MTPTTTRPKILDLDSFEPDDTREPFAVILGGKTFTLLDISDIDYREFLSAQVAFVNGNPRPAMEMILAEKDRDRFFGNVLSVFKLDALFAAYNKHFDVNIAKPGSGS